MFAVSCAGPKVEPPPELAASSSSGADASSLMGTTWEIGDYVLNFREPPNVHISGEAVPLPGGVMGDYKVEGNRIEISAVGKTYAGFWDGEHLVVDGVEGNRRVD